MRYTTNRQDGAGGYPPLYPHINQDQQVELRRTPLSGLEEESGDYDRGWNDRGRSDTFNRRVSLILAAAMLVLTGAIVWAHVCR